MGLFVTMKGDLHGKNVGGRRHAWNRGKLLGQKPPLKHREIWAIRVRLQLAQRSRDLALFNLGIDSKLRGCDSSGLKFRT
jgi:hypothetical protein